MNFHKNDEIANSRKDYPEDAPYLPLVCESCGCPLSEEDPEGVYCLICINKGIKDDR